MDRKRSSEIDRDGVDRRDIEKIGHEGRLAALPRPDSVSLRTGEMDDARDDREIVRQLRKLPDHAQLLIDATGGW